MAYRVVFGFDKLWITGFGLQGFRAVLRTHEDTELKHLGVRA